MTIIIGQQKIKVDIAIGRNGNFFTNIAFDPPLPKDDPIRGQEILLSTQQKVAVILAGAIKGALKPSNLEALSFREKRRRDQQEEGRRGFRLAVCTPEEEGEAEGEDPGREDGG